jgi:hypothetical protein
MTLQVTNGGSTAGTLRATSLTGEIVSWDDPLHVGPLVFDPAESRRVRAGYLAEVGWGEAAAIEHGLERRDVLLAAARHAVIWVEHDLYDQLQLLQILAQAPDAADLELIQADVFLGTLDPPELEALWPQRAPVSRKTRAEARDAWRAVTAGDLDVDVRELPHLAAALRRLAEEREELPRTKRQLLTLLADGAKTPFELFRANQELEEAQFLGDTWCFLFMSELAADGLITPVPPPPPRGDHRAFASTRVELTPEGRQLV